MTTTVTVMRVMPLHTTMKVSSGAGSRLKYDGRKTRCGAEERVGARRDARLFRIASRKHAPRRVRAVRNCCVSSRIAYSSLGRRQRSGAETWRVATYRYIALTRIPTIRPKVAPTAIEGTKMPAGTLQPYETMTRHVRMTVARRSELTMRHWAQVLHGNHASERGSPQIQGMSPFLCRRESQALTGLARTGTGSRSRRRSRIRGTRHRAFRSCRCARSGW